MTRPSPCYFCLSRSAWCESIKEMKACPEGQLLQRSAPEKISLKVKHEPSCGGKRLALLIDSRDGDGLMLAEPDGKFDLDGLIRSLQILRAKLVRSRLPEAN